MTIPQVNDFVLNERKEKKKTSGEHNSLEEFFFLFFIQHFVYKQNKYYNIPICIHNIRYEIKIITKNIK